MLSNYNESCVIRSLATVIVTIFLSPAAQTQVLEEIIVTAQRREQSIMEVPISLEAFSGDVLKKEGLRTLVDLANFSPSVEIDVNSVDQASTVRGLGTYARNFGVEGAVPIFVDGTHFGRVPMVMGGFMDLERIEVLRGPQPIAFGHNATAGAFSLVTRNPGPEWQGDVSAEYGNFGRINFTGGIGGPITNTLGIRVAGKWDKLTGFIRDILSGDMFPYQEERGARVTLRWAPADNFETTLKVGFSDRNTDGNAHAQCLSGNPQSLNERAVIMGLTSLADTVTLLPLPDCDNDGFRRIGTRESQSNPLRPPPDIYQSNARTGIIDMNDVRNKALPINEASDNAETFHTNLTLDYTFANDFSVTSISSYVDYRRIQLQDSSRSLLLGTQSMGAELFNMWSEEIRFLSPRGGRLEWEVGAYYQKEDLHGPRPEEGSKYINTSLRNNLRTPNRWAAFDQDSTWLSAFAGVTYNFWDDKASIDVGGRYTQIDKEASLDALVSTYIFNINPIDPITGRANSTNLDGTVRNVAGSLINCATGHPYCGTYGAGFWSHQWNLRDVPDVWNTQSPVDFGAYFPNLDLPDGVADSSDENNLDPQVTLRYRPTDNINLYGKWAKAFKGAGYDIRRSTPPSFTGFRLNSEYAETFELGVKGSFLDGRAIFNATLFTLSINNLQLETEVPAALDSGSRRATTAGEQRTRGLEMDLLLGVTDRLTLGLNGALMDAENINFPGGGCNDVEFRDAGTGPCLTAAEAVALYGDARFQGTIDRTGYEIPRVPDYKFVLNFDYWHPVFDRHKVTFTGRSTISDGYISDIQGYSEFVKYGKRNIANLTVGFGDQDDTWSLNFWVRNLLGRSQGQRYYREFFPPDEVFNPYAGTSEEGVITVFAGTRDYTTYGLLFNYNYN